jgi:membrane-associated phospholipid phosphatase
MSLVLIPWSLCLIASIVYLGEHYVVDALDGLLYVFAATILVEAFMRWRARRQASTPAKPSA